MKVEIWSDVVCPWCYVGKRHFEEALAGFPHRDRVEIRGEPVQRLQRHELRGVAFDGAGSDQRVVTVNQSRGGCGQSVLSGRWEGGKRQLKPAHFPACRRKRAVAQLAIEQPVGIDRSRHRDFAARDAREADARIIIHVADQQHKTVAGVARGVERFRHQRLPDALRAEGRFDGERSEQQRRIEVDQNRRHAIGADQQRANPRDEGQREIRRHALAQPIGRAREAPGTESVLIEFLDGGFVVGGQR